LTTLSSSRYSTNENFKKLRENAKTEENGSGNEQKEQNMGRPKKIIDSKPNEPIYEFDVITFKKSDDSRGSKKGAIGTIVDVFSKHKNEYGIVTQSGDVSTFNRLEFRLATPGDVERHKASIAVKEKQQASSPKAPIEETDII
jgi:hypothetical protein